MKGRLDVICGPMFSGKSEELIRRLRRASIAKENVKCYKPIIDNRYANNAIASHSSMKFPTTPIETVADIVKSVDTVLLPCVVGVDEVQFLDESIVDAFLRFVDKGHIVIVSGLNLDSNNKPYSVMANLLVYADNITKLSAICVKCHADATKTYRKPSAPADRLVVGGADLFEARCTTCHALVR